MKGYRLTDHAAKRILEMEIDPDLVAQAVFAPERKYEQLETYGPGRWCYQTGDIGVITDESDPKNKAVVTVVWRRQSRWNTRTLIEGKAR